MRIDLNNILMNGVEREGETRKARGKSPNAPNVEDGRSKMESPAYRARPDGSRPGS